MGEFVAIDNLYNKVIKSPVFNKDFAKLLTHKSGKMCKLSITA